MFSYLKKILNETTIQDQIPTNSYVIYSFQAVVHPKMYCLIVLSLAFFDTSAI